MATPQELLGGPNLSGLIQRTPSGIPLAVPVTLATPTRQNIGPTIQYYIETGTKRLAQITHYGAPPRGVGKAPVAAMYATAMHATHFHEYSIMDYQNMMAPDGSPQRQAGEFELVRQTRDLKQRFVNLRYATIQRAILDGILYFDANGDLLPSSSGAVYTVDYQIPAAHKNQLDGLITASWATATTDIPSNVQSILDVAPQRSGLPITTAIYGSAVPGYLLGNNYAGALIKQNPATVDAFSRQAIPSGFLGIQNWIPAGAAFYANASDSNVTIWGTDRVTFMPDVSTLWYDFVECSYLVPTQLGTISIEALQAAGAVTTVYGMFSYAKLLDEPIKIKQIAGDTFLPMITNNLAIFCADVVP